MLINTKRPNPKLSAILWDYDGTLVNSYKKNFAVTKEVLFHVNPGIKEQGLPPTMQSLAKYQEANYKAKDWRDLYSRFFDLSSEQINEAEPLWSKYQAACDVQVEMLDGLPEIIKNLGFLPHGICSQNCSIVIRSLLAHYGLSSYFKSIIGYRDIPSTKHKPNPGGFIKCLEKIGISRKEQTIFYIGDHEQDIQFAKNAEIALKNNGQNIAVSSIAVCYTGNNSKNWSIQPDYIAYTVQDIKAIIQDALA